MTEAELSMTMRGIEATHASVTGDDDPGRAARAIDAMRARLAEARARDKDDECSYSVPDQAERLLFTALCFRYGLAPFRRPRARAITMSVLAPRPFVEDTLWPEFVALADELSRHLGEVTARVLRGAFPETVVELPADLDAPPSVEPT